jgi:1,4-alpha-glucan branching enzyme
VKAHVALVLHAHLPWVRHPEHERPLEERWLHEALWESYLPILDALDRLVRDRVHVALTISVSPPLAAMLADPLLRARFEDHMSRLARLAEHLEARQLVAAELVPALAFYRRRIDEVRATFTRIGGDVLGALREHERAGRIELWTTTATHAYLPGLASSPAAIRAQLRVGLLAFERLAGVKPRGLWLPECAYDPRFGPDLAAAGVRYTILDAHGLELARPRPLTGVLAPVISPSGVAFFARDPDAARDVWSRKVGYPGDPAYREFYRDVGFDLPEDALCGEVGPYGARVMTGLKLHSITGSDRKSPSDLSLAEARVREHARHFVEAREAMASEAQAVTAAPILVAPFDAELFGHWWFEGPLFLEHALRALDASSREGGLQATTIGAWLAQHPEAAVAEPAASSWGEGGFGAVWAGPESARLWRHVHHVDRAVRQAVQVARHAEGLAGRALDQAIRESLLLQSSDWAFMIRRGEVAEYAEARVRAHAQRALRLASIAVGGAVAGAAKDGPSVNDLAWVHAVCDRDCFLQGLAGEELRGAFDRW